MTIIFEYTDGPHEGGRITITGCISLGGGNYSGWHETYKCRVWDGGIIFGPREHRGQIVSIKRREPLVVRPITDFCY